MNTDEIQTLEKIINHIKKYDICTNRLHYGFKTNLAHDQLDDVIALNKHYQKILWSLDGFVDNDNICQDEVNVIKRVFNEYRTVNKILEVGCGSGRVTNHLRKYSTNLTAIDFLEEIIHRAKTNLSNNNIKFMVHDFTQDSIIDDFDAIFLMENFIGMISRKDDREQIYKNVYNHLNINGIAVFGIRVIENINENFIFQAMPSNRGASFLGIKNFYGVSINWTIDALLNEISKLNIDLKLVEVIKGDPRSAGGSMFHCVFKKSKSE